MPSGWFPHLRWRLRIGYLSRAIFQFHEPDPSAENNSLHNTQSFNISTARTTLKHPYIKSKIMSLFPLSFCGPADAGFTPLFRLLEDFDNYSREVQAASPNHASRRHRHKQPRSQLASFSPKFDVCETENAYELHGELPGLDRENVNIEFTDAQTIVIRGRVERSYGPESSNNTNAAVTEESNNTASAETSESEGPAKARRNSHQAIVEDDPEDENTPASTPATTTKMEEAKPVSETTQTQAVAQTTATQPPHNEPRYWLWERSVGEFSRAFSFPARVDHDSVTASLNNGILTVSVPKAKTPVTRRIEISA
ncbi:hypothetical protein VTI74DRAFT_446 [Chaetomium olivicolor]